ncbi:hypothetical protein [Enterobacter roggenkampii]|uniref:hypothetical protein n=1 Tax=Enterobacter roggenkampii TaxID=1812935 RepID=UPI0018F6ACCA|nr:hypothetical protein [Enterobacter roggenkampii]
MTLEQRVEALEKPLTTQNSEQLTVEDGGIYINDALINDREINAAQIQAAIDNAIANHKATAIYNPDSL